MTILYEDLQTSTRSLQLTGWTRTTVLALGGALGVMATAGLIHLAKRGRPEAGPRGWTRTAILSGGAFAGTMATAGVIHLIKQSS